MSSNKASKKTLTPPPTRKPTKGRLVTANVHGKSGKPKPTPKPTTGKPVTKGK
ncbi:hypothetical protein KAR91_62380 [Candidatus Pacearchaeota archaeon]|nr:hypothetical protein [Candidatus Pacearchaeota archaeon]